MKRYLKRKSVSMSDCKTYKNVLDPWEIVFQQFYELQYISSYVYFVRKKKGCMLFSLFMKWVSQCCLSYKLVLVLIASCKFCLLFLKCISQGFISASWLQFILRCLFQHLFARALTLTSPYRVVEPICSSSGAL